MSVLAADGLPERIKTVEAQAPGTYLISEDGRMLRKSASDFWYGQTLTWSTKDVAVEITIFERYNVKWSFS